MKYYVASLFTFAFVLVVKLLAIKIRNNSTAGIEIPDLGDGAVQKLNSNNWLTTLPNFLKINKI